jgi:hypothetical protein
MRKPMIYCCEGCGRDTANQSQLCNRCDPAKHEAPAARPVEEEDESEVNDG